MAHFLNIILCRFQGLTFCVVSEMFTSTHLNLKEFRILTSKKDRMHPAAADKKDCSANSVRQASSVQWQCADYQLWPPLQSRFELFHQPISFST